MTATAQALPKLSTVAMPTLIEGTEALRKEFVLIAAAGKKLDTRIQIAGLSVMHHIDKHGDVTVATALVNELFGALSKGHRKAAMVDWLVKYAKVKLNTDESTKKAQPFVYDKHTTTDMAGAMGEPWYECKVETPPADMDFKALLLALVKKANKQVTDGKAALLNPELLAQVELLVQK